MLVKITTRLASLNPFENREELQRNQIEIVISDYVLIPLRTGKSYNLRTTLLVQHVRGLNPIENREELQHATTDNIAVDIKS